MHKSVVYQVNIGQFSITRHGKNIYRFYMFPIPIAFFLFPIYHFSFFPLHLSPLYLPSSTYLLPFLSLYFIQDNCHAYFHSSLNALILQSITLLLTLPLRSSLFRLTSPFSPVHCIGNCFYGSLGWRHMLRMSYARHIRPRRHSKLPNGAWPQ